MTTNTLLPGEIVTINSVDYALLIAPRQKPILVPIDTLQRAANSSSAGPVLVPTAHQVNISQVGGNATFGTPQDIDVDSAVVHKTIQAAIFNKNAACSATLVSGVVGGSVANPSVRDGLPFGSCSLDLSGASAAAGPVIIDIAFANNVALTAAIRGFSQWRDTTTGALYGGSIQATSSTVMRMTFPGSLAASLGNIVSVSWQAYLASL